MTADVWTVIDTAGLAALDRGPRAGITPAQTLMYDLAAALAGLPKERIAAGLATALLWHDDLAAAHELCQAHEGQADCDYVHALLHRREGDFSNAKYWFREVGEHPINASLAVAALRLGLPALVDHGRWRPAAMVDACAAALSCATAPRERLMQLQAAEFAALAAHVVAR